MLSSSTGEASTPLGVAPARFATMESTRTKPHPPGVGGGSGGSGGSGGGCGGGGEGGGEVGGQGVRPAKRSKADAAPPTTMGWGAWAQGGKPGAGAKRKSHMTAPDLAAGDRGGRSDKRGKAATPGGDGGPAGRTA